MTNQVADDLLVIETATNSVVATVPVGNNPTGLAITPNRAFVYAANYSSNAISVKLRLVKFSCFLGTDVAHKLFRAFFALKLGRGGSTYTKSTQWKTLFYS